MAKCALSPVAGPWTVVANRYPLAAAPGPERIFIIFFGRRAR